MFVFFHMMIEDIHGQFIGAPFCSQVTFVINRSLYFTSLNVALFTSRLESHSTSAIERLSPKTTIESRPTLAIEQMSSKTAIEPQSTPANQAEGQSDKRQTCP
jgi:hypothetical protein